MPELKLSSNSQVYFVWIPLMGQAKLWTPPQDRNFNILVRTFNIRPIKSSRYLDMQNFISYGKFKLKKIDHVITTTYT